MRELIASYLEDHKQAWAETTVKSETARLNSAADLINKGPQKLYDTLSTSMKPYSLKTLFMRIIAMEAWAIEKGLIQTAEYKAFMKKYRNRFKHAYVKEEVGIGYDEAVKRIGEITGEAAKRSALGLLQSGLRISEIMSLRDGRVRGKGGKTRRTYAGSGLLEEASKVSPTTLRRRLKEVGLKPHQLRKLCATRLAEKGASPADLCKVFGWSAIATAYQYLQSKDDKRLMEMMK